MSLDGKEIYVTFLDVLVLTNWIAPTEVVVKVLHIPVHVGQGGLVSAVSMLTVLVPLTVMTMVFVMIVLTLQFAGVLLIGLDMPVRNLVFME